jgi:hypothetical protein
MFKFLYATFIVLSRISSIIEIGASGRCHFSKNTVEKIKNTQVLNKECAVEGTSTATPK